MIKNRKLKKTEVIMVSRILEDVNFKYYIEYLLSNKVEKILSNSNKRDDKIFMIMGDIMAFIIQNLNKAEENIDLLIMSYQGINQEQVNDMDIDNYINSLKTIFMAGVPAIIADYVDMTKVKKKLEQLKEKNKQIEN